MKLKRLLPGGERMLTFFLINATPLFGRISSLCAKEKRGFAALSAERSGFMVIFQEREWAV